MFKYLLVIVKKYLENYKGLPKTCWKAITLVFIQACVTGVCFFLSLYFVNDLHIAVSTSGLIMSCYGIGTVIGSVVNGILSDKFSPKIIAIINLIIETVAISILGEIKIPILLMIDLFVLGIATFGLSTSINVWMLNQCDNFPQLRVKAVNISRVALNVGFGVSAIVISYLTNYGFHNIFYLYTFILFLSIIYFVFVKDSAKNVMINRVNQQNNLKKPEKNDKKIINFILISVFFVGLIIAQLSVTYPIYIKNIFPQLGLTAVSILFMLDTVLIALFQAPLVNTLSKHNHLIILGWGALLMGFGVLILNFSIFFFIAMISCIFWTTGEMLFIAMSQLICYEKSNESKKGIGMGTYQMAYAASKIIGPTAGAYLFALWGGKSVWYFCAFIGGLCFVGCNYYKKYI